MLFLYQETRREDILQDTNSSGEARPEPSSALLARVSMALTGPLDERLRMERLAPCLVPALADWCLIDLFDASGQLQPAAFAAERPERLAVLRGLRERHQPMCDAARLGALAPQDLAIVVAHTSPQSRPSLPADHIGYQPLLHALGCQSALIVRLFTRDSLVGVIVLGAGNSAYPSDLVCAYSMEVGRRAAIAIENARLYADERAARAEAEAAIRARDDLTAFITHDLRNPLAIVQGQADLLLRHLEQPALDSARLSRGLSAVRAAAVQMRLLLDDLQDVAHLRAGQPLQLEREPVDLVALARRVAAVQQAATTRHIVRIEAVSPALWCFCDVRRLERALANLLGNAIKFSPAGGMIKLAVDREEEEGRQWATVAVSDSGIGIPRDDLPHIFTPFRRASNVRKSIRGSGLGLASVHEIVTQHGGEIVVSSEEGKGSTFTVRLPPQHEQLRGCERNV